MNVCRRSTAVSAELRRLIATPAYKELTIRSLNTTLKLRELLAA